MTKKLLFFIGILMAGVLVFSYGAALADDLDCFDGSCGGSKGLPKCPAGSKEIFWITYANNDANVNEDCTTVVSCTNFNKRKDVAVDCRFFHGFNGILAGGGPQDALCDTGLLTLGPGEVGSVLPNSTTHGVRRSCQAGFSPPPAARPIVPPLKGRDSCVQVVMVIGRKLSARPTYPAVVVRYW